MRCFKYFFCNSVYSRCFKSFWGFANTLLHIRVKMENKVKKILNPLYSIQIIFLRSSKILFCVALEVCFFSNGHIHNVVPTLRNVFQSILKMRMLFWRCWTLFKSSLKQKMLIQCWLVFNTELITNISLDHFLM